MMHGVSCISSTIACSALFRSRFLIMSLIGLWSVTTRTLRLFAARMYGAIRFSAQRMPFISICVADQLVPALNAHDSNMHGRSSPFFMVMHMTAPTPSVLESTMQTNGSVFDASNGVRMLSAAMISLMY